MKTSDTPLPATWQTQSDDIGDMFEQFIKNSKGRQLSEAAYIPEASIGDILSDISCLAAQVDAAIPTLF